jgi:hypothetical protein
MRFSPGAPAGADMVSNDSPCPWVQTYGGLISVLPNAIWPGNYPAGLVGRFGYTGGPTRLCRLTSVEGLVQQ